MTNKSLSDLTKLIEDELKEFNRLFKQSLKSNVALVDLVARYLLRQKSKKIRPLLVLLSSKICGGITERSYRGATMVELLHTATLVHDDVVDNAETRRTFPSINAVWKNKIAVLMGDYLLARGLMLSVNGGDFDFLQVITNTVKRMSEGELLQIGKTRRLNNDEATYYRIISDKTASLLSTCCEIGARAATSDGARVEALRDYGENLGVAFQIRDDILDYVGIKNLMGKPLGGDIKEKKLTLPLIYALRMAPKSEAKKIISLIRRGAKKVDVAEVVKFTEDYGGIQYADKMAHEYADRALKCLIIFEENEPRNALENLVSFIVERKN